MGKSRTTTAKTEPWRGALPVLEPAVDAAAAMGPEGFTTDVYGGPRVAKISARTRSGIEELGRNPYDRMGDAALRSNLNMGDTYRDFDTIRDTVGDSVKAQLASTFAGGGINSSLAQDTYTRALGESLAGVEYGAYNDAKARQMQALGMIPAFAQNDRLTAQGRIAGGSIIDDRRQRLLDARRERFDERQNRDIEAIERFANLGMGLGGLGGSQSQRNPVSFGETLGEIGTGLGAIGTGLAFFSDEGLKKNVNAHGDRHVYEYLWSPIKFRGHLSKNVPERVVGQWLGFDIVRAD